MKLKTMDLENYQPLPVAYQLRYAILQKTRKGLDPLPDIQGRDAVKKDVLRALLSGAHPYLVSEEGTGKTRLAKSLVKLLPAIPVIRGCPYRDDPKWPKHLLCPRCQASENPEEEFGIELVQGARRFSRIQGNEYTNEAKLLGLKDIQAIVQGKSPSDPEAFIGTGVFRANRGLLFIDELPAIRNKVQVLLHPVLEERKAILEEYNWEHHLDLIVIATGNPEGFSHVNEVPRPLLDRLELIYMDLPEETVERDIIQREKFKLKNEFRVDVAEDELISFPSLNELERKVIAPWWITNMVNGAVRHSRTCSLLDKKASIRGSIRALDHTYASAELDNRKVATLTDACLGLRLAMRGRIRLRADLNDFDNPQESIRRTDRVTDDLLWNAFENFDLGFAVELGQFRDDISELVYTGLDNITEKLPKYPELNRAVDNMRKAAREAASDHVNPAEKEIFMHPDRSGKQLLEEYNRSAVDILVNIAWHKKLLEDSVLQQTFIPRNIQQGDF
jgi:magnesium chelatase subunit I